MRKLTRILEFSSDGELFHHITSTFRESLTTWDYFVCWQKVLQNWRPIEKELNLMNYLIGKENLEQEIAELVQRYPETIPVFPILLAARQRNFEILLSKKEFLTKKFDFSLRVPTHAEALSIAEFVISSGLGELLKDKTVKNLVDYVLGVEVGLDSNGRKNRGGVLMEDTVEIFLKAQKYDYLKQATQEKIQQKWGWKVEMDQSSRVIDFAIKTRENLYLMEVNFYSAGGSKLKSTAGEYCEMWSRYRDQGYEFLWVTDGAGWHSTLRPLEEYFRNTDYLLNLAMLQNDVLSKIIH